MKARRRGHLALLLTALATAGLAAAAVGGLAQQAPGVVTYRPAPQKKGRPVDIPRGESLLALFLQQLADATGESVCLQGEEPASATVSVPRSLSELDEKVAAVVLGQNGFEVNRQAYRGREVIWVQKQVAPPRRKGKIVRPGGAADEPQPPAEAGGSVSRELGTAGEGGPGGIGGGAVKLYAREAGSGPRYVVSFETDSRREADAALELLRAHAAKGGSASPPR
jgi:hypothetical protein